MKMYRKKSANPISAKVFEWGMESGVMMDNKYIPKNAIEYADDMGSKKHPGYIAIYDRDLDKKGFEDGQWNPYVITVRGEYAKVSEGDWVIPELNGIHFYPCKPDIFAKTYEEVDESEPSLEDQDQLWNEVDTIIGDYMECDIVRGLSGRNLVLSEMMNRYTLTRK